MKTVHTYHFITGDKCVVHFRHGKIHSMKMYFPTMEVRNYHRGMDSMSRVSIINGSGKRTRDFFIKGAEGLFYKREGQGKEGDEK